MARFDLDSFSLKYGLSLEAAQELGSLLGHSEDTSQQGRLSALFEGDAPETQHPAVSLPADALSERAPMISAEDDPIFQGDGARYECLGLLGRGGMGEVWRVRDRDLNRTLAMKIIRWELVQNDNIVGRFIDEAQTCAQLEHPGIIPVFEIGQFPDGRYYFTMQEVRGRTLSEVIDEVHDAAQAAGSWATTSSDWTLHRVISAFARVCETMAYAHRRGVIHRDLKPANIMISDDGQVLVVDWGIAKILNREEFWAEAEGPVVTRRQLLGSDLTQPGAITGTPNYMSLEQALSRLEDIDSRSDVYALGAILYRLLSGQPPYGRGPTFGLLMRIANGPPTPIEEAISWPVPLEVLEICARAMSREREARYRDAQEMAVALREWLDGVRRRERALASVGEAAEIQAEALASYARAAQLEADAVAALRDVPPFAPEDAKMAGWELQDAARQATAQAALEMVAAEQRLLIALNHDPDSHDAHAALAAHHRLRHERAEATEDAIGTREAEVLLRTHVDALLPEDPTRVSLGAYLAGDGRMTLRAGVEGAMCTLSSFEMDRRRLMPRHVRSLGEAPFVDLELPMGSYLVTLEAPGHEVVSYPVHIERQGHWHGRRPGEQEAAPIWMPRAGELAKDEVYVPQGWFVAGGEPGCAGGFEKRSYWAEGLVVKRFPVTNREYLVFLNALLDSGRQAEAEQHAPRERAASSGEQGSMLYTREDGGAFALVADPARGRVADLDWPVTNIDWAGAHAYSIWYAAHTGQPWRLPSEWEFEKYARGVDGRRHPWGPNFDASWACMQNSHAGPPMASVVDSYDADVSVYGVRGTGGNVSTWCLDEFASEPPEDARLSLPDPSTYTTQSYVGRGGAWFYPPRFCQSAWRFRFVPTFRYGFLGARLVRSV